MDINPVLGTGFESFWLGERLQRLWAEYYFMPNQAHNGYLEIYINLGCVGLFFLIGMIFSCYRKTQRMLMMPSDRDRAEKVDFDIARFGMAYLSAYLIYNITEAAFKELTVAFVVFLVTAIEYRQPHQGMMHSYPNNTPRRSLGSSRAKQVRFFGTTAR
jgi:O-antigen ligase